MIIKTHKELAVHIQGKNILHSNSLGKDSLLCLEWLVKFAKPGKIVSVYSEFIGAYPSSARYFEYLKKKYPTVEFIKVADALELSDIIDGWMQSPLEVNHFYNKFEYISFSRKLVLSEIKKKHGCDFICEGHSGYEGFGRAVSFHKKGLVKDDRIFPLGMMKKADVMGLIKGMQLKLHPSYKFAKGTFDHPSYYKMKRAFDAVPEYKELMYKFFPLMRLDEYRYEVLFEKTNQDKKAKNSKV